MRLSFFILLLANFVWVATLSGQEYRTWTSLKGDHRIEAQYLDYDSKTKQVELATKNDETISVDIYKLSVTDQRFIKRVARKRPQSEAQKSSAAKTRRETAGRKKRKFGIHWTLDLENALKVAEGKSSPSDDRLVMWLRVLGELDGFM